MLVFFLFSFSGVPALCFRSTDKKRSKKIKIIFFFLYISSEAIAPVIISTSSPVMTACRVRLYRIWYFPIISPAFLEAFCGI